MEIISRNFRPTYVIGGGPEARGHLYEGAIYGASKLTTNLAFEWTVDFSALTLSVLSIFIVGILSGLTPALKAEKLKVIEALRSE